MSKNLFETYEVNGRQYTDNLGHNAFVSIPKEQYIEYEQLKEENKQLKEELKNKSNVLEITRYLDIIRTYLKEIDRLQQKIDKALKYIDEFTGYYDDEGTAMFVIEELKEETFVKDLLQILGDKENE